VSVRGGVKCFCAAVCLGGASGRISRFLADFDNYRGASMQLSIAVINVAAQQMICQALTAASAGSPGKYMLGLLGRAWID